MIIACLGEVGVGYYFPYDAIIRCTGFNVCSNGGLTDRFYLL